MTFQLFIQCLEIALLLYVVVSSADCIACVYFSNVKMTNATMLTGIIILFAIVFAGLYLMDLVYLQLTGVTVETTMRQLMGLFPDPLASFVEGTHWAL